MGVGSAEIRFIPTIPPFADIQTQFALQTGLNLQMEAQLNLTKVTSDPLEISTLLHRDIEAYNRLKQQVSELISLQRYEEISQLRNQLTHLNYLQFSTPSFRSLTFDVKETTLEFHYSASDHNRYFLNSLLKSLVDLGGKRVGENGQASDEYPSEWKRLKQWKQYRWYNRPKR